MKQFSELMASQRLLPIIQADTPEQGIHIARAMAKAGLTVVEVVLRSEASLAALEAIKAELPELIVGAGTVIDTEILARAIRAGADFIVTPAVTPNLLEAATNCGVPVVPGVASPADIALAREYGFRVMKLFPATLAGGVPFLQAVSAVFRDVVFCPTGGIKPENQAEFLALPNVIAVGGTWVAKKEWVEAEDWQQITQACVEAQ